MDKANKPKEVGKFNSIIKEMKRNFSRYMTKLGAHVSRIVLIIGNHLIIRSRKIAKYVGKKALPFACKLSEFVDSITTKVKGAIHGWAEYFYRLKDETLDKNANSGTLKATGFCIKGLGRSIWANRKAAVYAFNWIMPAVCLSFLIGVVNYVTTLNYGVSVECNGQQLGVVTEEGVYDDAAKVVQEKITYVEGNETVTISPKLSIQVINNASNIVNPNQLAEKLITNTDADLVNAYGLYLDGQFMGALTDRKPVMTTLANTLAKYESPDVKSIAFQKDIEYRESMYLASSVVDPSNVVSKLTSNTQTEVKYTIQENDTPSKIAAKNNISLSELRLLNPSIDSNCQVGDSITVTNAEPFMSVKLVKEVVYTDPIKYSVEKIENNNVYKGAEEVLVEGENGEKTVKAEVTIVNGYEVGRTILSSNVTKEAVTEKISVGTKIPQPTRGVTISGNGQYAWPVGGGYISAHQGDGRGHKGIDIAASAGTAIFAAEAGTVIVSQDLSYGYGRHILIQHADGNVTMYAHQSKRIAQVGQKVQKGELIGLVGNTGDSQGNHCHFEVRHNGSFLDPEKFVL